MKHIVYKQVKDFTDDQIKMIALRYANTPYNYASRAIATEYSRDNEYSIKPRTIMKLVQKAIKRALISEETAKLIKDKAVRNSGIYGDKTSSQKTLELYSSLIFQRREFLANGGKIPKRKKFSSNLKESFCEKVKFKLDELENSLKELNFKIETFDEFNEEEITLDDLLNQKENVEREIRHYRSFK